MGSGGGGSVGSGSGGGASLVGDAGGGFGALVDLVGFGARGGVVAVRSGFGGAAVDSSDPPPAGIAGAVVTFFLGVAVGADRVARDAGGDFRAVVAGLTVPTGLTSAAGFWAGVAFAIAAARAPVAITEPAATPFVTSDSRRSARSRWWVGGDAIESLSARAWTMPSPPVTGRERGRSRHCAHPPHRSGRAPHRELRVLRDRPPPRSAEVCIKER